MPVVRFTTSEVRGQAGKGSVGVGIETTPNVVPVNAGTVPAVEHETFNGSAIGTAALAVGLLRRVDVEVQPNSDFAPLIVRAKVQLLGKTQRDARVGDVSFAVTFGGGRDSDSSSEGEGCFGFCALGPPITATVTTKASMVETGALAGYRMADHVLLYGGVTASKYRLSSTVVQTVNATGTSTTTPVLAHVTEATVTAGIEASKGGFVTRIEGGIPTQSGRHGAFGVLVGYQW